jgi:diguanylate cyclase (GGDEF)-like protein
VNVNTQRRLLPRGYQLPTCLCLVGLLALLAVGRDTGLQALAGQCAVALSIVLMLWCLFVEQRQVDQLHDRCRQYEHDLEQRSADSKRVLASAAEERARLRQAEAQRTELSALFLNLQHLGRELSGDLEIDAISRLVTEAARKLLNAPNPRLFLLDEATWELVEHRPDSGGARYPADCGILGWVIDHGQMVTADDLSNIHSLAKLEAAGSTRWQACAPLSVGQRVLGVLALDSIEQRPPEFERLLYILANFSAVALNNSLLFERVERMARHDGLTGLLNHAAFQTRLHEMVDEARRSGRPLSVVIADLDHFKQINDRYLHQGGDHVLRCVADLWRQLIPSHAVAARYGGEEFVCVYPDADLTEAAAHAEVLRHALEFGNVEFEGTPLRVTASFGVATLSAASDSAAALVRQADTALYAAKRSGRNRVCVAHAEGSNESTTPAAVHGSAIDPQPTAAAHCDAF